MAQSTSPKTEVKMEKEATQTPKQEEETTPKLEEHDGENQRGAGNNDDSVPLCAIIGVARGFFL